MRRFIQEAKAASALNHPNILTIHEIGEVDDAYYLKIEHWHGSEKDFETRNGILEDIAYDPYFSLIRDDAR